MFLIKIAKAAEMGDIDRKAMSDYGIPGIILMENAGAAVARKVEEVLGKLADKKVSIFAGPGNNGGDGYVAARYLRNKGMKVKVFLLGDEQAIGGDARIHLDILLNTEVEVVELAAERDWDKAKLAAVFTDCLVDALLGTGFHGELAPAYERLIQIMNTTAKPVVAVDIPSAIYADTGQLGMVAVKATHTVTFGLPKLGLLFQPGASYAGQVTVADIGIPVELTRTDEIRQQQITMEFVRQLLPERMPWDHKGSCGRVLVVAGSQGLTGAAFFTTSAAVKAGAGLVTLALAASLNPIMEGKMAEVMTKPLPETAWGSLGLEAVSYIQKMAADSDVLAIGPGLGRGPDTAQMVRQTVSQADYPLVIDADGLNALEGFTEILLEATVQPIITPHPGEMARLTGLTATAINGDRLTAARQAAANWGVIVVLKGPGTVVALPDGQIFVNTTGNPGMATGGTGDVLTGVIAAFIGQGLSGWEAAVAGVYVHGLAGDLAAAGGMIGMTATAVLEQLPTAIRLVQVGETR